MGTAPPKITPQPIEPTSEQVAVLNELTASGQLLVHRGADGETLYVRYGEGWAVPAIFAYDGRYRNFEWSIVVSCTAEGRMGCVALQFATEKPGEAIDRTALLDFPLPSVVEEVLLWVAREVNDRGEVVGEPLKTRARSLEEAKDIYAAVQTEHRRRSRGRRRRAQTQDELLDEVARVYIEAASTKTPTQAVYEHLTNRGSTYSRAYVGRLVQEARSRNKLPPAPGPGRAGIQSKEEDHG